MEKSLEKPIGREALVDQVIDRITTALIHRELKPGDRLPTENELMSSFHVGRSSIREAIKILQSLGIVEVKRGNGTYVATRLTGNALNPMLYQMLLDPGTMEDLIELRCMFEPAYTVLAARNATDQDLEKILAEQKRLEALAKEGKHTGDDDIAFHNAILEATHNPYVIRIGKLILNLFVESVGRSSVRVPEVVLEDHRNICNALLSRDEEAIRDAVLRSFKGWVDHQEQ